MTDNVQQDQSLEQQLALLHAVATNVLTLPPVFVDVTGSHLAGLLLKQCIYWTEKNLDKDPNSDGWLWVVLPKLQQQLRAGKHALDAARKALRRLELLQEDLRGVPPRLYLRVDMIRTLTLVNLQLSENRRINYPVRGKSQKRKITLPKPGNNDPKTGKLIVAEPENPNKEEKTLLQETLLETEGRDSGPRASASVLAIQRERFWLMLDKSEPDPQRNVDADKMDRVRICAVRSGLGLIEAKKTLSEDPRWRKWPYLSQLDSQGEIAFPPDPPKAAAEGDGQKLPPDMDAGAGSRTWEYVRDWLRHRISPHSFDTWIKPVRSIGMIGQVLCVRIPTPEFHHISEKFAEPLMDAMNGRARELVLLTLDEQTNYDWEKRATA